MPRVVLGSNTITQATGSTTTVAEGRVPIGPNGRLKAVSVEASAVNQASVYVSVAFAQGSQGMNLIKGWVRGPSTFADSKGMTWYGDIPIGRSPPQASLVARQSNDTGASASVILEWVIEHD